MVTESGNGSAAPSRAAGGSPAAPPWPGCPAVRAPRPQATPGAPSRSAGGRSARGARPPAVAPRRLPLAARRPRSAPPPLPTGSGAGRPGRCAPRCCSPGCRRRGRSGPRLSRTLPSGQCTWTLRSLMGATLARPRYSPAAERSRMASPSLRPRARTSSACISTSSRSAPLSGIASGLHHGVELLAPAGAQQEGAVREVDLRGRARATKWALPSAVGKACPSHRRGAAPLEGVALRCAGAGCRRRRGRPGPSRPGSGARRRSGSGAARSG